MVDLFSKIFGYVEIEISGDNIEGFLNSANKNSIYIWDLRYKNRKIIGRIAPKNFKLLRSIKSKTTVKIKILKKRGLIFRLNSFSGRTGLFVGIILFFLIISCSSQFLLGIKIESNRPIKKAEVLSVLNSIGIKEWAVKRKIDTYFAAQKLILEIPNVSWAAVNIEGGIASVNLKIEKPKKEDNFPSNIVAKREGIIKKIDVVSGETVRQVGDAVSKGDIIVSGANKSGDTVIFEKSKGEVTAETEHIYVKSDSISKQRYVNVKTKKRKAVKIFGVCFPLYLGSIKEPYTSKTNHKIIKIFNKNMPIEIYEKTYKIKEKRLITNSKEEIIKMLKAKINKEIEKSNFDSFKIKDEEITNIKNTVTVKVTVTAIENIAKEMQMHFQE